MKGFQPYFFFLIALFFSSKAYAQDPQYAQFAATAHLTNPALIGVYDGSVRATIGYREQWNTVLGKVPFRTAMASVDVRRPVLKRDFVGVGIVAMHDEVGESNFSQSRAHIGVSYMKRVGGGGYKGASQYLVAGGQFGYGQNNLETASLWFSDQFNAGDASINQFSQELLLGQSAPIYMDVNAGLLWYMVFDEDHSIYIGGAVHHITEPDISFFDNVDVRLDRKYTAQLGGEFPVSNNLSLLPAALGILQGKSLRIITGTNFRYTNRDWREVALRFGLWANIANKLDNSILMDAAIVSATLETERMDFGLSYDLNTSSLSQVTNSRGAFEFTFIYKQPAKGRKWKVNCPKF
ncbi:MAG: PorP/SprF family type IX secretion system membrane protein [Bacteroidota bacterium]